MFIICIVFIYFPTQYLQYIYICICIYVYIMFAYLSAFHTSSVSGVARPQCFAPSLGAPALQSLRHQSGADLAAHLRPGAVERGRSAGRLPSDPSAATGRWTWPC